MDITFAITTTIPNAIAQNSFITADLLSGAHLITFFPDILNTAGGVTLAAWLGSKVSSSWSKALNPS